TEILVGCADYLIASEVAYDCFLLAPPDDVDCLESMLLRQLKHKLPDAGCSRCLQEPVALLEIVSGSRQCPCRQRIDVGRGGGRIRQASWNGHQFAHRA